MANWVRINKALLPESIDRDKQTVFAYVDGSYDDIGVYGSGCVLLSTENIILEEITKYGLDERFLESQHISGEVFSSLLAIEWAIEHGFEQIIIHYDYIGIENWATGIWKGHKEISIYYIQEIERLLSSIDIHFKKIKAHSGDMYNELADDLASIAVDKYIKQK